MQKLDQDITALKQNLLEMGERALGMVSTVLQALEERSTAQLDRLREEEDWVNRAQVDIDRETIRLITIYGPAAMDLRFLMMVARITSDLERIGDLAINMWSHVEELSVADGIKPLVDLPRMGELAIGMVRGSLISFRDGNASLARTTLEQDDDVDALYDSVKSDLVERMIESPDTIHTAMALISLARSLERIADHSTNVCEEVIYVVEGVDIRHHMDEE